MNGVFRFLVHIAHWVRAREEKKKISTKISGLSLPYHRALESCYSFKDV